MYVRLSMQLVYWKRWLILVFHRAKKKVGGELKKIRENEKELKKNIERPDKNTTTVYKEANTRGDCVCVCERNCKHVCNRVHSVRIV